MHIFSYIDAGSGSMLVQAVIGVVLAGTVVFRSYFHKMYSKVKLITRKKSLNED